MDAIVLAGGLGTRLKSVVSNIPKPMAPINDKPFLHYILSWLHKNGISKTILSVGYKWNIIFDYFGESFGKMKLSYSIEENPLGTGGAIKKAMNESNSDKLIIINGDTYFDIKLFQLIDFHNRESNDCSVALKYLENFDRYGSVDLNSNCRITSFNEKCQKDRGFINGGIYIVNKDISNYFPNTDKFSFEEDFLSKQINDLKIGGNIENGFFVDIGIPKDYEIAQEKLIKL